MALKIKLAMTHGEITRGPCWLLRVALVGVAALAVRALWACSVSITSSTRAIVDERLKQPLFAETAKIYAAPREVRPGQKLGRRT